MVAPNLLPYWDGTQRVYLVLIGRVPSVSIAARPERNLRLRDDRSLNWSRLHHEASVALSIKLPRDGIEHAATPFFDDVEHSVFEPRVRITKRVHAIAR